MDINNILIFNWRCWLNPNSGGAEIYTREVAKRLVLKGYNVTLFTSKYKESNNEEYSHGIRIIRDGNRFNIYEKAKKYFKQSHSKEQYDIIIDEINTRPFHTIKYIDNQKIVALIHQLAREYWFYETPFPVSQFGYYFLENYWLKNYKNIPTITVSKSTKNDLIDLNFKEIHIINNGINVEALEKIPEKCADPTIIFVGRLRRAKKPEDVIKAYYIIRKEFPETQIWIIGDGYLRNKLERKYKEVKFFGYLDDERKNNLLKKAWVIAVPGIREGWSQVVTDANALGTPAVGYDIPGLRDSIKRNFNGLIVEPKPISLAKGILDVFRDKEHRLRLSKNALKWGKGFAWDNTAEEFQKVIEMVGMR